MCSIVERIDKKLKEKRLKRKDLCSKIGVNRTSITQWDINGNVPRGDVCVKIADFLGCDLRWLITGEKEDAGLAEIKKQTGDLLDLWYKQTPSQQQVVLNLLQMNYEQNQTGQISNVS